MNAMPGSMAAAARTVVNCFLILLLNSPKKYRVKNGDGEMERLFGYKNEFFSKSR
jgi:hypothetical protein